MQVDLMFTELSKKIHSLQHGIRTSTNQITSVY